MSMGVFSNLQQGVQANTKISTPQKTVIPEKKSTKDKIKEVLPYALPLVSIPIAVLISNKMSSASMKNMKKQFEATTYNLKQAIEKSTATQINDLKQSLTNQDSMKALQEQVGNLAKEVASSKKSNSQVFTAMIAAAGLTGFGFNAGKLSDDNAKEIGDRFADRVNNAVNKSDRAISASGNALNDKYFYNDNGISLLTNTDSINKHKQKYQKAINTIKNAASKYLYEQPKVNPLKPGDTVWSITSEFAPVKEGGLGSVPVEVQKNMEKLGVNTPTFVPMYQDAGLSFYKEEDGKHIYQYKGEKNRFELDKVASLQVTAYQGLKPSVENVDIFVAKTKDGKAVKDPLYFIKNDKYFNGTIYQTSEKTEEPEKFAFYSKVMYEFMKAKSEEGSVKNLVIHNKEAYNKLHAPDALILNDWQASPVAALARYKAPMENAFKKLGDDTAEKISNINIITIGHNTMYQGSTSMNNNADQRKQATSNILNTLFDGYTKDIVDNAKTKSVSRDEEDPGLRNLNNVLILNRHDSNYNHTNLLGMGICLSNYFNPVSKNYAKEIISHEHQDLSGELRWFLNQRKQSNSMVGIINGNDFDNITLAGQKGKVLEKTGLELELFDKETPIDELMKIRERNKIKLYNEYVLPLSMKNDPAINTTDVENVRIVSKDLEFVDPLNLGKMPELSNEELLQTPIIASVGRMVSQKGIDVMSNAIEMLFNNWEKDFPGKNKPLFYIAGEDPENGAQRKFVEDLKTRLPEENNKRVMFAHGFGQMQAIAASSDFFLLPSYFEPCGLTQGEALACGTPVIASAVGGIVDTVNRNGKNNGILTNHKGQLKADDIYQAMKKGLDIYFNQPEKYKNMVKDAISEDFSWIQPNKEGPVYDYLVELGFDKKDLKEKSELEIKTEENKKTETNKNNEVQKKKVHGYKVPNSNIFVLKNDKTEDEKKKSEEEAS